MLFRHDRVSVSTGRENDCPWVCYTNNSYTNCMGRTLCVKFDYCSAIYRRRLPERTRPDPLPTACWTHFSRTQIRKTSSGKMAMKDPYFRSRRRGGLSWCTLSARRRLATCVVALVALCILISKFGLPEGGLRNTHLLASGRHAAAKGSGGREVG